MYKVKKNNIINNKIIRYENDSQIAEYDASRAKALLDYPNKKVKLIFNIADIQRIAIEITNFTEDIYEVFLDNLSHTLSKAEISKINKIPGIQGDFQDSIQLCYRWRDMLGALYSLEGVKNKDYLENFMKELKKASLSEYNKYFKNSKTDIEKCEAASHFIIDDMTEKFSDELSPILDAFGDTEAENERV